MGTSALVDSPRKITVRGRQVEIVTSGTATKILGIQKVTLYAWIRDRKIEPIIMTSEKGKKQFVFDVREISRVKALINRKWKPGDKKYGG